jgi:hypothetical protein
VSSALQAHVAAVWVKPLIKDGDACAWFSHQSLVIRTKAAQAIPMDELEALSKNYEGNDRFWEAAQLISTVVKSFTLPTERQLGLVRQILANLGQISDKQLEHHSLEAGIAVQFI